MRIPSAHDLVRIWELGQDKPGWYQALLLLAAAFPERAHGELAALPLGVRNQCLFTLRARLIGQRMDACVNCPDCGEALEFSLGVDDLCPDPPPSLDTALLAAPARRFTADGIELTLRLADSRDLEAISRFSRFDHPARDLACRCVESACCEQTVLAPDELDETVLDLVAEHLAELDPLAERRLALDCNACGHTWSALFDIMSFLWAELSARAQRLLGEVHVLASNYGWREADILHMTSVRRQRYLDLLA
jgi:hypothetical protein